MAFLDVLSPDQRERVVYDADDPALREWVYFPTTAERNGVALDELDAQQRAGALQLIDAVLSDSGSQQVRQVLAAEDALGVRNDEEDSVNSGRYFISLFGEPSATDRFSVQFNGHHLAVNHTYEGEQISATPAFTGVDPTSVDIEGATVRPMAAETAAFSALVASLGEEGLAAARIGAIDDVLVGEGESEAYPETEGLAVAELSSEQQARLTDVLRAWVGDTDERTAEVLMAQYVSGFDATTISWTGSQDPDEPGAYLRVAGPRLWLEFSNVGQFDNGDDHYHSIWRDRGLDYLS